MEEHTELYKIGEFSQIVGLPVRTLRYYDEKGVLKPSEIDDFTGYRYYTDEDVVECELIKLLKGVNFTLEEIVNNKNNLTDEVMNEKQDEISRQINLLEKKYEKIKELRKALKSSGPVLVRKKEEK